MSRKPIHLKAQGPKGDRQAMWEVIRSQHAAGRAISITSIWAKISPDAPRCRVRDYLVGLEAAGYLERTDTMASPGQPAHYRLARDVGVEAPRVRRDGSEPTGGLGRERLWRTLRILGEFTAAELAGAASTPDTVIAEDTAKEYTRFLADAGYLTRCRQGAPGIPARFRLVASHWTGPRPPMILATKSLYDPNTNAIVYTRVPKGAKENA